MEFQKRNYYQMLKSMNKKKKFYDNDFFKAVDNLLFLKNSNKINDRKFLRKITMT